MWNFLSRKSPARRSRPRRNVTLQLECLEDRCAPAILQVGPAATYTTIAQAAAAAKNGDTIQIQAGTYTKQEAIFTQSNLTIQGVGGTAVFNDSGYTLNNQKGIFDIRGNNVTVQNIEFEYAHDTTGLSNNYAGIRGEGNTLTLRDCSFFHNDDGILINNDPNFATDNNSLTVTGCEFGFNGFGDGYSHNMYVGEITQFTLRDSYSHDAFYGHLVKSRALTIYLLYNDFVQGSATGDAQSSQIDLPYGGKSYLVGNEFTQPTGAANGNIITYDAENGGATGHPYAMQLYLVNNTIVNNRGSGTFVAGFNGAPTTLDLTNNIFAGGGTVSSVTPTQSSHNLVTNSPGFVNEAGGDYHLAAGSPAIDAGTNPGSANGFSLTPVAQYVAPLTETPRVTNGSAIDIGAFEYLPPVSPPAAPSGLKASPGNAQVSLTWTGSTGATSYSVYEGTKSGGETLLKSGVTTVSFTATGLADGTVYYFKVTASNASGSSGFSSEVSATPHVPPPAAPASPVAVPGDTTVTLSWTASTGASSYNVYRGLTSGGEALYKTGIAATSFTDTGLTNGTTYYYKVSAVNAGGESGLSVETSGTPKSAAPASGPTHLATTPGNTQVALTWTASVPAAPSYDIYRGTASGALRLYKSGIAGTSFTDTGLNNGTTYYYQVTVGGNAGLASNTVSATPWPPVTVSPTALPTGTVGGPYAQTLTASGGSGGYSYRITSGSLPRGLTLNAATGALSGIPGAPGSVSFTVTATDSHGDRGSRTYTLVIASLLGNSPDAIYVENLYGSLLHRAADPGASSWVNLLNQGLAPSRMILALENSAEYLANVMVGIYQHYLDRAPDPAGLSGWVSALQNGLTIEQVIAGFIASPEFYQVQGGGTNAGFVTVFYQDILGRQPDQAGFAFWLNGLNTGTVTPASMAWGFLTSPEYDGDLINSYYQQFLERSVDSAGLAGWVQAMQAGLTDQGVLAALLGSAEGFADWS